MTKRPSTDAVLGPAGAKFDKHAARLAAGSDLDKRSERKAASITEVGFFTIRPSPGCLWEPTWQWLRRCSAVRCGGYPPC